jgi:hypothetical protein
MSVYRCVYMSVYMIRTPTGLSLARKCPFLRAFSEMAVGVGDDESARKLVFSLKPDPLHDDE